MECVKQVKREVSYQVNGKKMKISRIEKDWTIERLSEISHVTRKTISEIERGKKRRIRFSTLDQIAAALGKEIDCFCTQNGKLDK